MDVRFNVIDFTERAINSAARNIIQLRCFAPANIENEIEYRYPFGGIERGALAYSGKKGRVLSQATCSSSERSKGKEHGVDKATDQDHGTKKKSYFIDDKGLHFLRDNL